MLEIALDVDEEWDSSRSWEPLVRRAAEAAIAESAFPQLARSERPVELSVRHSVMAAAKQVIISATAPHAVHIAINSESD